MIKNFIKIAFRNLSKNKGLTLINILGLSIGLACSCLFIFYAIHEFSFDRFHENSDSIYRVYRWTADMDGEGEEGDPHMPMPLGPALKTDFPDVAEIVRWKEAWGENFVKVNGQVHRIEVCHVEPTVFDVFSFPLKFGSKESALSDPKNVVLTEKIAKQIFGESNPTGKIIEIKIEDEFVPFNVSAIAENVPTNSSKQFQIMGSFEYFEGTRHGQSSITNWNRSFLSVFVQLREGSGLSKNAEALLGFREKYYPNGEQALRESGNWTGEGPPVTYKLQPIAEMHTDTGVWGGEVPAINPRNIWILLGIAGGVLLIAIINFTTLSIGRSASRAKEVGIRKVVGSSRKQLSIQFLAESLILTFISAVIGLGLANLLLPFFNELSGRELSLSLNVFPESGWLFALVILITGFLAGSYPAFMLSRFRPIDVFRKKIKLGGSNFFTKSLVTSQFVISSGLVMSTFIIMSQMNFWDTKNPGFQKENVIIVDAEETNTNEIFPRFKKALLNNPEVLSVASSELAIGEGAGWSRSGFRYQGELKQVFEYFIDDDFMDVMNMELLSGRNFEPGRQDGKNFSVIANESMVKDFGWTVETAVGQELTGYFEEGNQPKVIGVVKDFHYRSFKEAVLPQMFHQYEDYAPYKYFVKIKSDAPSLVLSDMEKAWKSVVPELPFKYSFLDEDLNRFYRGEARFSKIISWSGVISIFLTCLGLMGLAALAAANRTKEIGIRKVLGANVATIIGLLSKDFIRLLLIAFIVATPIAYYLMHKWLQTFVYHIDIQWWVFVLAGIVAIGIAFITVALQSMKAAMSNPVDSLRRE